MALATGWEGYASTKLDEVASLWGHRTAFQMVPHTHILASNLPPIRFHGFFLSLNGHHGPQTSSLSRRWPLCLGAQQAITPSHNKAYCGTCLTPQ